MIKLAFNKDEGIQAASEQTRTHARSLELSFDME